MLLATESSFPLYTDIKTGLPLDGGYLYFGVPNNNPETNALPVYWDAAGAQQAAQPIRTLNGYPVRNGTPALLFIDGDYSVTVRDHRGRFQWTLPSASSATNSASILAQLTTFITSLASSIGSSLVGFIQNIAGAIARTLQDKNRDLVSTFDFAGIDPTGSTDSTTGFTAALAGASTGKRILIIRAGTYKLGKIPHGSNVTVLCEPNVTFNTTCDVNTEFISLASQSNVQWYCNGAQFNGNRAAVTLTDAGNQTCFYLYGPDNVLIQDANIANFGFDGITLTGDNTGSGPCNNVRLIGNDVTNCGRNALSIIHADTVTVQGGRYWLSNGTPSGPWAGIDVEPNGGGQYARNINFIGVKTQGNNGAGYQFTPGQMSSSTGLTFDVTVTGCRSQNDGLVSTGATGKAAVIFANGGALTNEIMGQVMINGLVIDGPNAMGVSFRNWDALLSPRAILDNVLVINPNANSASTGVPNQSAFVLYTDSSQAVTSQGKITMRNCKAIDNRGTAKMQVPVYIGADAGKTVTDVKIVDMEAQNYLAATKSPVKMDFSLAGSYVDVSVTYTNPKALSVAGNVAAGDYPGQLVNMTTAAAVYTLPLASKCKGTVFPVQMDQSAGSSGSIARTSTDLIKQFGIAGATSVVLQAGDSARARSEGGTTHVLIGAN